MKTFITQSNYESIVKKLSDIRAMDLSGEVYKRTIYFFSKYEEKTLLALKSLIENPEDYLNKIYVPFEEIRGNDRFIFVNKKSPSYHLESTCFRLKSDYKNYFIPDQIYTLGEEAQKEFRDRIIPQIKELEDGDISKEFFDKRFSDICMQIVRKYSQESDGFQEINLKAFLVENSGICNIQNLSANELEELIDEKIKEAGRYYYGNDKNTRILKRFSRATHLSYTSDSIQDNNTGYSDEEVKEFLMDYDKRFKKPLKRILIQYYMIVNNSDLSINNTLLEELNFKECRSCKKKYEKNTFNNVISSI
ncbi:MAG: hypothetical protein H8E55_25480 [Pelagibacterales bacterium]|nr:hypothetical protein [Pelagibacterales bacterium]